MEKTVIEWEVPVEYREKIEAFTNEVGLFSLPSLLNMAVDQFIENWPWGCGDICVFIDECMHRKTVEDWRREQHETTEN